MGYDSTISNIEEIPSKRYRPRTNEREPFEEENQIVRIIAY